MVVVVALHVPVCGEGLEHGGDNDGKSDGDDEEDEDEEGE